MVELAEWNGQSKLLPRDAERPNQGWLAAKVAVLLGQFWQDQESEAEYQANLATWCSCLSDLPWEALDWAINERLKQNDRRKPIIGEIREAALSRLEPLPPVQKPEPVFIPKPDRIDRDRMEQIAEEMGATEIFRQWFPNKGDAA